MAGLRYAPEFPKGAADAAGRISTVNISSVTLDAKTRSQSPLNIGAFLPRPFEPLVLLALK